MEAIQVFLESDGISDRCYCPVDYAVVCKQPAFRVDAFRHVVDEDKGRGSDPELSPVGLLMLPKPHLRPCHQPLHAALCHSGKIVSILMGAHGCHSNPACTGFCYGVQCRCFAKVQYCQVDLHTLS